MVVLSTRSCVSCPALKRTLDKEVREHSSNVCPWAVMVYTALPYQSLFVSWMPTGTFYILLGYMLPNFLHIPSFKYKRYSTSSKSLEINQECFEVFIASVLLVLGRNFIYMTCILHSCDSFLRSSWYILDEENTGLVSKIYNPVGGDREIQV